MPAARRAYFRTHRRARERARFVRSQRARLKALERRVAACASAPPPKPPSVPAQPSLPPSSSGPACAPLLTNTGALYHEGTNTDFRRFFRPLGSVRAVMLFVDFPDVPRPGGAPSASRYESLVPPAVRYYAEVSYGRMSLSVTPVYTWFRMPRPAPEYAVGQQAAAYLADAIRAADAQVDFGSYQMVFVVPPPSLPAGASYPLALTPGRGVVVDGVEIRHGLTLASNAIPAVVIHELGHLFGLPDLFGIGWDLMGFTRFRTPHLLAWHKYKIGWLDPDQLRCLEGPGVLEETITPLATRGGVKAVVVPVSASRAYVLEVRSAIGEDNALCSTGLLVYEVDAATTGLDAIRVKGGPGEPGVCLGAPLDLRPGKPSKVEEPSVGLTVEVLIATDAAGFRVRVTRR